MPIRRMSYLLNEGDSMLLSTSPFEAMERLRRFQSDTNLSIDDMAFPPLVSVPIPRYRTQQRPGRWPGVPAEQMWNPLFWLPSTVSNSMAVDGEPESEEHWAVRVALVCSLSGAYDEITGTWLDTLSLAGMDVENPEDRERIRRWQAGGPDAALDALDLTELLYDGSDPYWATDTATDAMPDLYVSVWATNSKVILDLIGEAREDISTTPLQTMAGAVAMLTSLAQSALSAETVLYGEDAWWRGRAAEASRSSTEIELLGVLATVEERVEMIYDAYWPQLEEMRAVLRS